MGNIRPEDKPTLIITCEVIVGIILSIFFIKYIDSNNNDFWGRSYFSGFIRLFGYSSLVFFFSVFSVGIIGAVILGQKERIANAITYSIAFWFLSIIAVVFLISFLGIFSLYIILIGIVIGLNYGLKKKPITPEK